MSPPYIDLNHCSRNLPIFNPHSKYSCSSPLHLIFRGDNYREVKGIQFDCFKTFILPIITSTCFVGTILEDVLLSMNNCNGCFFAASEHMFDQSPYSTLFIQCFQYPGSYRSCHRQVFQGFSLVGWSSMYAKDVQELLDLPL